MRIVGVSELEAGDVLERPVNGSNGIVMLEAGTVLTEQYISRLKALRIKTIYLANEAKAEVARVVTGKRDIPADTWIRPNIDEMKNDQASRREAVKAVQDFAVKDLMLEQVVLPFPDANFRQQLREILAEISSQPVLAEELGVMMSTDRLLFEHALNVTLCANIIGTAQRYDSSKLYDLSLGALFCDIGMIRLPAGLTKVNRELDEGELAMLRQHTNEGYRVLKGIKEVPISSAQCALLHHERYRGSGYPLGMTNDKIPEFAQIVAIADVYNALGSLRHHRNAYGPIETIEYLFASGYYDFDWDLIKTFLNHLVVYPVSTCVRLSSGQLATVMETENRPIQRPLVQVYCESDGKAAIIPYLLDLREHMNVVIVGKDDK
ncbi:HD-GYP domain-containing protein [Cohnella terricola]|uniref:HD domain-containing protein n=1 Tax=Cohnella terricola TaxID=1289167 RepID=A0A559JB44_9BACL|nr:HD domain-containing phosphohydrolase [Cohnella terricola]TVX97096.1 HD domain-containing protein [Cohnella terricola]